MAERISALGPVPSGRPAIYPWPEWTDGSAWRITRGEDFVIAPSNMAAVIRSYAHRVGLRATARVSGAAVEFQFLIEPTEPLERAA